MYVGSYAFDASTVHHPYGSTFPTITRRRRDSGEGISLPRPREPLVRDGLGIGGTDLGSSAASWRGKVTAGARHLVSREMWSEGAVERWSEAEASASKAACRASARVSRFQPQTSLATSV